jgi:hypothetical protein
VHESTVEDREEEYEVTARRAITPA